MKKIYLSILMTLALLGVVSQSWAAWTITTSINSPAVYADGSKRYLLTIEAVSDGSDPAEFNFTDEMSVPSEWTREISGGLFYEVITDPGTAPDAVWTLAIDDDLGASILDLSNLSVSATERHKGSTDLGYYPTIGDDLQIDIGDIGSNLDSVTIYIVILK